MRVHNTVFATSTTLEKDGSYNFYGVGQGGLLAESLPVAAEFSLCIEVDMLLDDPTNMEFEIWCISPSDSKELVGKGHIPHTTLHTYFDGVARVWYPVEVRWPLASSGLHQFVLTRPDGEELGSIAINVVSL